MKPRLLDLFSGAGGAAMGYHRAGFEVVGVDIKPQPNYPFEFWQTDALEVLESGGVAHYLLEDFAAVHSSPPCQAYSGLSKRWAAREHPELIPETRELLQATGLPYVIENVEGAALIEPTLLCGSMSEPPLDVRRHRLFETIWSPRFRSLDARAKTLATVVGVHGHLNYSGEMALREQAMEIDWMTPAELSQAIPPRYTRFVGDQLLAHINAQVATP